MQAVKGRDTLPEIVVRKWLFAHGYPFRVCDRRIIGRLDIVLPRYWTLIEIRGCFWHHHGWEWGGRKLVQTEECAQATAPKTNRAFWNRKFRNNVRRDQEHEKLWREDGWNVISRRASVVRRRRVSEKTVTRSGAALERFMIQV